MYCQNCMQELLQDTELCPYCASSTRQRNGLSQLPAGTVLQNRYLVGRVLGSGGFGITYIGRDLALKSRVAVKEFFPADLVRRNSETSTSVQVVNRDVETRFAKGKERFLQEAQTLESLGDVSRIVKIKNIFYENETVYIVMEYLEGQNLKEYLSKNGPISFEKAFRMLEPVMEGVEKLHAAGLIHRDISPSNLMLLRDGSTKLLDLGCTRAFSDLEKSVSVVTKPGYTPMEQYSGDSAQGSWTDVYAFCATIYKLITDQTPDNSLVRMAEDKLLPPSAYGAVISAGQESVLMRGLAVLPKNRIQTMAELRAAFRSAEDSDGADGGENDDEKTTYGGAQNNGDKLRAQFAQNKTAAEPIMPPKPGTETPPPVKPGGSGTQRLSRKKERGSKAPGKKRTPVRLGKKWIIAAAIATILLVAGGAVVLSGAFGATGRLTERFNNETVTVDMIAAFNRNKDSKIVNLETCVISDEAIAELGKNPRITQIVFVGCTGFTDLSPLADIGTLNDLTIKGASDTAEALDVSALFGRSSESVTRLTLVDVVCSESDIFAHFPNLWRLTMDSCVGIKDLDTLSRLSALSRLCLKDVDLSVVDLTPVGDCSSLTEIQMDDCGISDIRWMEPLSKLTAIRMKNGQISDISVLADKEKLQVVNLENNLLTEIEALRGKERLHTVRLSGNQITDISPLEYCTEIQTLYLADNGISDISACTGMIRLVKVDLKGNHISDLSGLSNTTQIEYLNLTENEITDIAPISRSTKTLKWLMLGENRIEDLSPLRGTVALEALTVHNNRLRDLKGLENCESLMYLYAHGNELQDITALSSCTELRLIDLAENQISDLSPIGSSVVKDQYLFAQHNQISDLSCLEALVDYSYLYLYDNPLRDLGQLQRLEAINPNAKLAISWDETVDYAALFASNFQYFRIAETPLYQQVPLEQLYKEVKNSFVSKIDFPTTAELDEEVNDIRVKLGEKLTQD